MSWSRNGHWLATSGGQGVLLWSFKGRDGPMGQTARQLAARESLVTAAAFHPKGRLVAVGYRDGCIVALNWASERVIVLRAPDGEPIRETLWGPAGAWFAFAAGESVAGIIATGQWLHDRL